MSMLAGPKRKQKIIIDPRETVWTKDDAKFGKKMLEQMGWSKGQGLGKNRQGITAPLKPTRYSKNKGIGFKDNDEDWVQHFDAFEGILANLNADHPEDDSKNVEDMQSLELKSKSTKNRVHYKKITQGKDLSRYKEEDLACILGSKKTSRTVAAAKESKESPSKTAVVAEEPMVSNEEQDVNNSNFSYNHGGNLKEYFEQKMSQLKLARSEGVLRDTPSNTRSTSMPISPLPDLDFEPERLNFSFNFSVAEEPTPQPDLEEPVDTKEHSKSKKKKKKRSGDDESPDTIDCGPPEDTCESKEKVKLKDSIKNILKKKRKNVDQQEEIDICEEEPKSKKKRKRLTEESENVTESSSPVTRSEKRKNKQLVNEQIFEQYDNEINLTKESKSEVSNKKLDLNNDVSIVEELAVPTKKSKKSKKKSKESNDAEQPEESPLQSNEEIQEKPKKKSKKSKEKDLPNEEAIITDDSFSKLRKSKRIKAVTDLKENEEPLNETVKKENEVIDVNVVKEKRRKNRRTQLNESYMAATSPKAIKSISKDDTLKQDGSGIIKKMKKFASDISVVDVLKNNQLETNVDIKDEHSEVKVKSKLTKKRSFKEITSEFGDKLREKLKKSDKNKLKTIEENIEPDNTEVSSIVTLNVPVQKVGYGMEINERREMLVDLNKIFPGSNAASIKGYCSTDPVKEEC